MAEAGLILIAVRDAVLANSLCFSLELEGYAAKLCPPPFKSALNAEPRSCLLLDQDVFATMFWREDKQTLGRFDMPTVLIVNKWTPRLLDQAKAAGVTAIVEEPLLGGVLFDAIRSALDGTRLPRNGMRC